MNLGFSIWVNHRTVTIETDAVIHAVLRYILGKLGGI